MHTRYRRSSLCWRSADVNEDRTYRQPNERNQSRVKKNILKIDKEEEEEIKSLHLSLYCIFHDFQQLEARMSSAKFIILRLYMYFVMFFFQFFHCSSLTDWFSIEFVQHHQNLQRLMNKYYTNAHTLIRNIIATGWNHDDDLNFFLSLRSSNNKRKNTFKKKE